MRKFDLLMRVFLALFRPNNLLRLQNHAEIEEMPRSSEKRVKILRRSILDRV
jgi:hypothetical protein